MLSRCSALSCAMAGEYASSAGHAEKKKKKKGVGMYKIEIFHNNMPLYELIQRRINLTKKKRALMDNRTRMALSNVKRKKKKQVSTQLNKQTTALGLGDA
jgi:hypothetical protein